MENTILNRKCKECKWFDWGQCTEPERNRINKEKGRDYYRNFRRSPSEPACKRFKEKENDMTVKDVSNYIYDCEESLRNVDKTLDILEKELSNTPDVDNPRAPKNKYGIGETLYLPVTIAGIRESVNGSTILYEVKTAFGKRLGFKVFECASDIWRDKDHYMVSIPENLLVENFEEA